ncbi:MAG: preprotein translocase subunit SecA [Chloroflexota bacterium]|nr:preprotein translocase subunit SecA [Chloroflexota bacterium]
MRGLFKKVVGDSNQREIARLQKVVEQINALEPAFERENLSDAQLQAKTDQFRQRLAQGETLDDILVEAFAAVREAAKRTIGLRHYDVQLIGGILLHQGTIVEMKTGEGKTLVATLPLYLNALEGQGVHLVTVNDYLARRDGGWMGLVFEVLGISVGLVVPQFSGLYDSNYVDLASNLEDERLVHWRPVRRQEAYRADVTYGTNNEFGFDYLRDNMVHDLSQCVQRELYYAIIDEVDNILIDEARTPLIISGPAGESSELYRRFANIVRRLRPSSLESVEREEPDGDYVLEERTQVVTLTERGVERTERALPEVKAGESIYDNKHAHMLPYLDNALRAQVVYDRDKGYIVRDGQVVIVDEFTGRLLHGRRYSEGLHQAIEAKEGVAVRRESLTYATVTFQNYFRMYKKLAGMTGTAASETEEFRKIYDLDVVVLPTNVEYRATYRDLVAHQRRMDEIEEVVFAGVLDSPSLTWVPDVTVTTYELPDENEGRYFARLDLPDAIYKTEQAKFRAVVDEIKALHEAGRPVLVGTIAIEASERLSDMLKQQHIPHRVLNGKHHEQEAVIIAQAGSPGAVTIATNMAGRGVDIVLGGNPEGLAAGLLEQRFKKVAEEFANAVVSGQEERALELVEGVPGFSPGSVELARTLQSEYESYELAAAQQRLPRFIADCLVREGVIERKYHGPVVGIASSTLREDWVAALDGVRLPEGLSQRVIGEVQRVRAKYDVPGSKTAYVANGLFSHYYMAMAALVRVALQGKHKQALALLQQHPELNEKLLVEISHIREQCESDRGLVRTRGGLHVIGTERHEARRIDNQLRGRSARQGDPGSSCFYISLEDELMRRFGGDRVQGLMGRFGMGDDVPIQHSLLDKTIESAQMRVEGYNFDIRKHVLEYDDVVNKQREVIYAQRREVLSQSDLRDQVLRMVREESSQLVSTHMPGPDQEDWDLRGLYNELRMFLPLKPGAEPVKWAGMTPDEVETQLYELAELAYDELNQRLAEQLFNQAQKENVTLGDLAGSDDPLRRLICKRVLSRFDTSPDPDFLDTPVRKLAPSVKSEVEAGFVDGLRLHRDRQLMLRAVDILWVRHLTDLEALREGIGLRAYGQQNPLVAYRKEAHEMYGALLAGIQQTIVRSVYVTQSLAPQRRRQQPRQQLRKARSGQPDRAPAKSPGRNDPCWCGSGLKYKNCHMLLDREGRRGAVVAPPPRTPSGKKRGRRQIKRR